MITYIAFLILECSKALYTENKNIYLKHVKDTVQVEVNQVF